MTNDQLSPEDALLDLAVLLGCELDDYDGITARVAALKEYVTQQAERERTGAEKREALEGKVKEYEATIALFEEVEKTRKPAPVKGDDRVKGLVDKLKHASSDVEDLLARFKDRPEVRRASGQLPALPPADGDKRYERAATLYQTALEGIYRAITGREPKKAENVMDPSYIRQLEEGIASMRIVENTSLENYGPMKDAVGELYLLITGKKVEDAYRDAKTPDAVAAITKEVVREIKVGIERQIALIDRLTKPKEPEYKRGR